MKTNLKEIKEAVKIPSIYRTIAFFLIGSILVPSFSDISYYFLLNVVTFSKFTVSMLSIIGFASLLAGIIIFNKYLKQKEVRNMLKYAILISFIGQVFSLLFALRLTYINDVAFVIVTSSVTDTLGLAFSQMPTMVLFAKITPHHIEATVFAVLTGMFNLCNAVISPNVGILINKSFIGVTSNNLENYYILVVITLCLSLTPLIFLNLIPLKKDYTNTSVTEETNNSNEGEGVEMKVINNSH